MGEVTAPGCGPTFGTLSSAPEGIGGGAGIGIGAWAGAIGTVTEAVRVRATRMRRSPFSTSISVRSVSARRVASSRTRSGSKGLALAIAENLCRRSGVGLGAFDEDRHQRLET